MGVNLSYSSLCVRIRRPIIVRSSNIYKVFSLDLYYHLLTNQNEDRIRIMFIKEPFTYFVSKVSVLNNTRVQ